MATLAEVEQRLAEMERRINEHLREVSTVPVAPLAPPEPLVVSVEPEIARTTTSTGGVT